MPLFPFRTMDQLTPTLLNVDDFRIALRDQPDQQRVNDVCPPPVSPEGVRIDVTGEFIPIVCTPRLPIYNRFSLRKGIMQY